MLRRFGLYDKARVTKVRLGRQRASLRAAKATRSFEARFAALEDATGYRRVWNNDHWELALVSDVLRVDEAALDNLGFAASMLEEVGIPFFELPITADYRYRLGVPGRYRNAVWRAIQAHEDPALTLWVDSGSLKLKSLTVGLGATSSERSAAMTGRVWRIFRPRAAADGVLLLSQAHGCEVEFWHDARPHRRLGPDRWNRVIEEAEPSETRGGTIARGDATYPTVAGRSSLPFTDEVQFPVDLVYTWVDGNDPEWQASKRKVFEELHLDVAPLDAHVAARYESRDELKYSLRSVAHFAPFVRRIFIVVGQAPPNWLNPDHPQIRVVEHEEIVGNAGRLPTFNSHVLESRLHHIEGLAEHYIYLNDDFMFGRGVAAEAFFHANGIWKFFPSRALISRDTKVSKARSVEAAAQNTRDLIEGHFGLTVSQKMRHAPYAQRRSVLMEMEAAFPEEFKRTASHQVRSSSDIAVASSLSHYFGYLQGKALPGSLRTKYLDLGSDTVLADVDSLLDSRDADAICVNDTVTSLPGADEREAAVSRFLETYYPVPSEYEV